MKKKVNTFLNKIKNLFTVKKKKVSNINIFIRKGLLMRLTNFLIPTLKEEPSEAIVSSHRLMLRAGLIKKESAGMYAYLPFGFKILNKIINIVREEMEKSGALEFLMPELTTSDLWKQSGRWETMGAEMIRIKDRNSSEYVLAPTHEEAFTSLMSSIISSYRDLPINVYQINTKFRDEIRPRYGVIRSKEFIMKDAYSFAINKEDLDKTYQLMRQVYRSIFSRCGLETIPVEADSGAMGGSGSEEFMVASDVGEENLLLCSKCDYQANQEKATFKRENLDESKENLKFDLELIDTPEMKTIEQLSSFLQLPKRKFLKSICYIVDGKPCLVVLPGDREVNEAKLKNFLEATSLELATDDLIQEVTGAPTGFAGPVGDLKIRIVYDLDVKKIINGVTGANSKDKHFKGVNPGRDFIIKEEGDLSIAEEGDFCPKCGSVLKLKKGIEVGHIFKLGDKYTSKMGMTVLNQNGKGVVPLMGCYGIGVNRTLAAIIEQHHDDKGIIWPKEIAPWQIHLVSLAKNEEEKVKSDDVYEELSKKGFSVLYDDRKLSPGFKFAEADLLGMPVRLTAGKTFFKNGELELKLRRKQEVFFVKKNNLAKEVKSL